MEIDIQTKLTIYQHFAETGEAPSPTDVARKVNLDQDELTDVYLGLRSQRVLVLDDDPLSIRMAPPFSGVPTQHRIQSEGITYYANCGWDALGVIAALHRPGIVHSRCEQSHEPFRLEVDTNGPQPPDWLFHSLVPAAKWWDDIVFT